MDCTREENRMSNKKPELVEHEAMMLIKLIRSYAKRGEDYAAVRKRLDDPNNAASCALLALLERCRADAKGGVKVRPSVRLPVEDPPERPSTRGDSKK